MIKKIKQIRFKDKLIQCIERTTETYKYIGLTFSYEQSSNVGSIMHIGIYCDVFKDYCFYISKEDEETVTDIIITHFKSIKKPIYEFKVKYHRCLEK